LIQEFTISFAFMGIAESIKARHGPFDDARFGSAHALARRHRAVLANGGVAGVATQECDSAGAWIRNFERRACRWVGVGQRARQAGIEICGS
jgi:hypothetical protein